jgi:hypothetical protein
MWAVVPDTYNKFTAPHIQASIFKWRYLRWFWWYSDNSMRATLQSWCQIQPTSSRLRYVNCGPGHIQSNYSSTYSGFNIRLSVSALLLDICRQFGERYTATLVAIERTASCLRSVNCGPGYIHCEYCAAYSGFNIQMNVSALILEIYRQFNVGYTATLVPIQRTTSRWRCLNCGPGHIQCNYSSTYSVFNIQLNVSPPLSEINRQMKGPYSANFMPNTVHILQITLCDLWCRTYTLQLQLRIFRHQYSTERICDAMGDISTIQCALYCNLVADTAHILQITLCELWSRTYTLQIQFLIFRLQYSTERISAAIRDMSRIQCALYRKLCAKCSAHPPDDAAWIAVPAICSVITAPHIQASIFDWTYLRCYWRYIDNSLCVILQPWWQ